MNHGVRVIGKFLTNLFAYGLSVQYEFPNADWNAVEGLDLQVYGTERPIDMELRTDEGGEIQSLQMLLNLV